MSSEDDLQEQIASLDLPSRVLLAEADIGDQAEEFLRSDLGRAVVGIARQEYAELVGKLESTPWWLFWRWVDLQSRIRRVKMFPSYLQELILRGRKAQQALAEPEDDERE